MSDMSIGERAVEVTRGARARLLRCPCGIRTINFVMRRRLAADPWGILGAPNERGHVPLRELDPQTNRTNSQCPVDLMSPQLSAYGRTNPIYQEVVKSVPQLLRDGIETFNNLFALRGHRLESSPTT
jgi:hypothetical protein